MTRLFTRRWLGLTLAVALVATACVELGLWQLRRLDQRRAFNAAVTAGLHAAPVPVGAVLTPGRAPAPAAEWRTVTVRGRYDPAGEVLVRNRTEGGRVGYEVLTPLVTDAGPALLVDRGFVPATGSARARPRVPAPASGVVTVTGRVRRGEAGGRPTEVTGEWSRIDVPRITAGWPYPAYGGYVELTDQQPPAGPQPAVLAPPQLTEGPHLAYAVQWFAFGLIALGGWVALTRRELRGDGAGPARADLDPALADPGRVG